MMPKFADCTGTLDNCTRVRCRAVIPREQLTAPTDAQVQAAVGDPAEFDWFVSDVEHLGSDRGYVLTGLADAMDRLYPEMRWGNYGSVGWTGEWALSGSAQWDRRRENHDDWRPTMRRVPVGVTGKYFTAGQGLDRHVLESLLNLNAIRRVMSRKPVLFFWNPAVTQQFAEYVDPVWVKVLLDAVIEAGGVPCLWHNTAAGPDTSKPWRELLRTRYGV